MNQNKWSDLWNIILSGEAKRWKTGEDLEFDKKHLELLKENGLLKEKTKIFVPMAGDCLFVKTALEAGHELVALEFVADAVEALKKRIGDEFEDVSEENKLYKKKFKSKTRAITIYQASIFDKLDELVEQFDLIYDKDAFGAIEVEDREKYLSAVGEYLKKDGDLLLAGVLRTSGVEKGPPFHLSQELSEKFWNIKNLKFLLKKEKLYTGENEEKPFYDVTYLFVNKNKIKE